MWFTIHTPENKNKLMKAITTWTKQMSLEIVQTKGVVGSFKKKKPKRN